MTMTLQLRYSAISPLFWPPFEPTAFFFFPLPNYKQKFDLPHYFLNVWHDLWWRPELSSEAFSPPFLVESSPSFLQNISSQIPYFPLLLNAQKISPKILLFINFSGELGFVMCHLKIRSLSWVLPYCATYPLRLVPHNYSPNCLFVPLDYSKDLVISFQRITIWPEALCPLSLEPMDLL